MSKENILISIILPTYNEVGNITLLIDQISHYLKKYLYEIIVVDDNSPDQTARAVKDKFSQSAKIRLFIKKENRGLAKAIRFGIEKSRGSCILVMDTDFNHHPKDIPKMIKFMYKADLIVGSRYIKGGGMENRLRYIISLLYNLITRKILALSTNDNLSGFFLMKKNKLEKLNYDKIFFGYGEYFIRLLFYARQKNFKIKEIPVFYKNRTAGESKSKFLPMFIDYSKTVLSLIFHQ